MSKFLELDIQKFASAGPLDEPFIVEGNSRYNWDEEKDCARSIEYQVHSLNGETISSVYDSRGNDVSASWGAPSNWLVKIFTYPYQSRLTFVSESGSTYSLDIIVNDEFEKVESNLYINDDLMIKNSNYKFSDVTNFLANSWNDIYPVGSYYTSESSINPEFIFGGTWKSISKVNSYAFYKWGVTNLSKTTDYAGVTSSFKELTVTSDGNPIFLNVNGDSNPLSATAWFNIKIYRNGTLITEQICESHGSSWNIPFSLSYLDIVAAGTYTYKFEFTIGSGATRLGENGATQAPQCMAYELGTNKGLYTWKRIG